MASSTPDLERQFDEAMMELYRRAKSEVGYNATRFLQMLMDHRGVETARRLLDAPEVSDGYAALCEHGRLDLTVEAMVNAHPEFHVFFNERQLKVARDRLR